MNNISTINKLAPTTWCFSIQQYKQNAMEILIISFGVLYTTNLFYFSKKKVNIIIISIIILTQIF